MPEKDSVDINKVLEEIMNNDAYEADYHGITDHILFHPISYEVDRETLRIIMETDLFM